MWVFQSGRFIIFYTHTHTCQKVKSLKFREKNAIWNLRMRKTEIRKKSTKSNSRRDSCDSRLPYMTHFNGHQSPDILPLISSDCFLLLPGEIVSLFCHLCCTNSKWKQVSDDEGRKGNLLRIFFKVDRSTSLISV